MSASNPHHEGLITQEDAVRSLFELLGDDGGGGGGGGSGSGNGGGGSSAPGAVEPRVCRKKFLSLTTALGYSEADGASYWDGLASFCRERKGGARPGDNGGSAGDDDDDVAVVEALDSSDIDALYGSSEYNPSTAAVGLMDRLKVLFRHLDRDESGVVTAEDIKRGIEEGILEGKETTESSQELDDCGFIISNGTAKAAAAPPPTSVSLELAKAILDAVDLDKNGSLDLTEFVAAVLKVDPSSFTYVREKNVDQSDAQQGGAKNQTVQQKVFVASRIDKAAMKRSLGEVTGDPTFGRRWLIGLFESYPETRALFANDIDCNVSPFLILLEKIIDSADTFQELIPRLHRLGVKHVQMGIKYEYFEHLLYAMLETFSSDVTAAERQMWVDLFALIYYTFMEAERYPDLMADDRLYVGNMVEHGKERNPMLDPEETSPEVFAAFLKDVALAHPAVSHSYLTRMADGDLPDAKAALVEFVEEYRHYGSKFVAIAETLAKGPSTSTGAGSGPTAEDADDSSSSSDYYDDLDDEVRLKHVSIVRENLAEERGETAFSAEERAALEEDGISDVDAIEGVPHRELFQRFREKVHEACGRGGGAGGGLVGPGGRGAYNAMAAGGDEEKKDEEDTESSPGRNFARSIETLLRQSSYCARVAALGVGIETIVPSIYESILSAVRSSCGGSGSNPDDDDDGTPRLSPDDCAFLVLHIRLDGMHGSSMEDMVADLANTIQRREEMLAAVRAVLELRVLLWDELLSSSLQKYMREHQERTASASDGIGGSATSVGACPAVGGTAGARYASAPGGVCPVTGGGGHSQEQPQEPAGDLKPENLMPGFLSDYTARPFLLDLCRPYASRAGAWVLDVGCGEGYFARRVRDEFGPATVVAVDGDREAIDAACAAEEAEADNDDADAQGEEGSGGAEAGEDEPSEAKAMAKKKKIEFVHGSSTDVHSVVGGQFLNLGLTSRSQMDDRFDLVTAVFLFNGISIADMRSVGEQVFRLLRPGGRFVFSVPHPSLKYWRRRWEEEATAGGGGEAPPFYLVAEGSGGYFWDRDRSSPGVVYARDGRRLPIQSMHKTFTDYFSFVTDLGFVVESVTELGAEPSLVAEDPDFFGGVDGVPLHVAIKAFKPNKTLTRELSLATRETSTLSASNVVKSEERNASGAMLKDTSAFETKTDTFLVPPKEVLWSCVQHGDHFVLRMSDEVVKELVESASACLAAGIDHTTYKIGDVYPMFKVKRFGRECAERLMQKDGNLIVQGLDIDALGTTEAERERMAKLCYYIIMTSTGIVNETRGRLFDVVDRNLDATKDNVLFSATNQECGWHSDGASKDWFPDMVNLLCIRPAKAGGEFQIANTVNAFYDLCTTLPKFLMYELQRPLVRDILEKGDKAFGTQQLESNPMNFWFALSRTPDVLRQRLRLNSYPIFERDESTRQHKFRYIDTWLRSGHKKAGLTISPLLELAIAELEKSLWRHCRFDRRLERGEITMANNHLVAHRRNEFSDHGVEPERRRQLVRCWLTIK